jgi:hypothetical protein
MSPSRAAPLPVLAAAFSVFLAGGVAGAAETAAAPDDEVEALMREAAADDARNAAAQKAAPGVAPSATPSPVPGGAPVSAQPGSPSGLRGFAQLELARAYQSPTHWSKMLGRVEFGTQGKTEDGIKWKLSARADYDAVFSTTNYYSADVRRDQQFNVVLRENYFDKGIGDWEIRVGRQHVIWGEMVGLFFADVVSARDMREFILPEFNLLRIPQWAVRAEYFRDDFHGELLWIPVATYDETGKPQQPGGKPGSEFFPYQTVSPSYLNEVKPARKLANSNYGARGSWLVKGWDLSAFYYRSMDASPTFYQQADPTSPTGISYQARHDRISQIGGTLAKDFGSMVLKAETVYTRGRRLPLTVLRPSDEGVVPQNTFDWVVSLDFPFPSETRLNIQAFQSITSNNDPDVIPKKRESGYSLLLNGKLTPSLEAEVLWVASLDRNDWMLRPKLNWNFEKNWRLVFGVDAFHGPATGFFGRYNAQDRVYSELRRSF